MPDFTCVKAMLRRDLIPALLALGLAAQFTPAFADVTVTPADKGYDIAITDQASASDLLDAIASATGASVKGEPGDDDINPTRLTGVSLERALRGLLPKSAFAIRYGADGSPAMIIFLTQKDGAAAGADDGSSPDMQDGAGQDSGSPDQPADSSGTAPDPLVPQDN
jgi:hypothetical protein